MEAKPDLPQPDRGAVKRTHAESYLQTSIIAFVISVLLTRIYLNLTGFPQLGNSVLHIAHALWGGLLLIIAALLPLILANRWAFRLSAVLSGIGVGLFIDEIGKFITQKNDYFFPPAAPLIYAFFLLLIGLFLYIRWTRRRGPREEMYRALEDFRAVLDNDIDKDQMETLLWRLKEGASAGDAHISALADNLSDYLKTANIPVLEHHPGIFERFLGWIEGHIQWFGRRRLRTVILVLLGLLIILSLLTLIIGFISLSAPVENEMMAAVSPDLTHEGRGSDFWVQLRLALEVLVAIIALAAVIFWLRGKERRGINFAIAALLISLTGVVLLTFYLNQLAAIIKAMLQTTTLLLVLAYRHWYG